MVDINFTLLMHLPLFLVFLWAMKRWVFRPLLVIMDKRDQEMVEAKEQTGQNQKEAVQLEQEYAAVLAKAHRKAHGTIARALREVHEQQLQEREAARKAQEEAVAQARQEALAQVEQAQAALPEISCQVAADVLARMGLGSAAS